MIPNIEDLTEPPVVGKLYMVPCIKLNEVLWPILGPRHEDREFIGLPKQHQHYDLRFLSGIQMDELCNRLTGKISLWDRFSGAINLPDSEAHNRVYVGRRRAIISARRRCMRTQPNYTVGLAPRPIWLDRLEKHLSDVPITCGRCPHRGMPLLSLPREPGTDIVTYPGHGLRWDLKTGKLIGSPS